MPTILEVFNREWPRQCGNPAKYAKPGCNQCHGRGVTGKQVAPGLASTGIYLMCPCAEKRYGKAWQVEYEAAMKRAADESRAAEVPPDVSSAILVSGEAA